MHREGHELGYITARERDHRLEISSEKILIYPLLAALTNN